MIIPTYLLPEFIIFIFILFLIIKIMNGDNTIGDFTLLIGLSTSLFGNAISSINVLAIIYEDKMKVDTVQKFLSSGQKMKDSGRIELDIIHKIEFCNVSFKYPNAEKYILDNISFVVNERDRICIVGPNGAGKSTIIKLLCRFYDVTKGTILINGLDISSFTLSSLRRAFSVSFQAAATYAFTLRDNILLSDIDKAYDVNQIYNALDFVNAISLEKKLAKGLDTHIEKIFSVDGYEASGGEYQKIAIARAIYRDCKVLILDEPTASLDPETEIILFENLKSKMIDKMIIFTSHKLSAVKFANRIIFFDESKGVMEGTHQELMSTSIAYAKFFMIQANAYK